MSIFLPPRKSKLKKIKIDNFFLGADKQKDQSVLSPAISIDTYNFDFSSGALKDGIGLIDLGIDDQSITNIWQFLFKGQSIIMFTRVGGQVYYLKGGSVYALSGIKILGRVQTTNYRLHGKDVIIMWSNVSNIAVWDGENAAYQVQNSPLIESMDILGDMAFIADADGQTLRFTSDLDPTNWNQDVTEGGKISFLGIKGRIGKVISFLNYLFVFSEFGITRISVLGDKVQQANLFVSSGKIFTSSVVISGDRIIFLSDSGLFEFDGLSTKPILQNLNGLIKASDDLTAAYWGGRYYLCCKGNFAGGEDDMILSFSPVDKSYSISKGIMVSSFATFSEGLLAVSQNRAAKIINKAKYFSSPLEKCWTSPLSSLGSEKLKILHSVHLCTLGDITLTIFSESNFQSVNIRGSKAIQRVRFGIRGYKFAFRIESNQLDSHVSELALVYSEV